MTRNLLTDVAGISVGNAHDEALASGATAILFETPAVAALDIRGGGPGTRDSALLDLANTVERIDGLALSGGSAFGLETGGGIQAWLAAQGRGFAIGDARVPIVPGAVVFDLLNGGNKKWGRFSPYRDLGFAAAENATTDDFALGNAGAGYGATTANYKGGLGSASTTVLDGITVAALAVVNAVGTVTVGDGPWFWSAPFEENGEFGGRGLPPAFTPDMRTARLKGADNARAGENTTLVVVATDAALTKPQARRLAILAQTGFARAIYPAHAPLDGDIVFAVSLGDKPVEPLYGLTQLGMFAANVVARAIARGVYEAHALPFADTLPAWRDRFGT
ncbi:peptidase S58, DmpA [Afipia carboxidovorans OM5]|uniref:Peptidase S58 n=1 Tax=Afipia carboxidovorans (strain ATCC 49405 / DSM 1227 / KCTC 32145 / OM5) TaxID=504832 RepID=B6JDW1_AFIC5|nr:P1 family peptidase [Afipia carboxidovorans]ACI92605.1 peptidase S58, DmpA [Afipia carboxidovorans OM5]AEI03633.1 peptidase S58 [Afipia carboxidovorans OM4]AEI07210.1 peptidase S58 [Afipia carboxidovorans OM5]